MFGCINCHYTSCCLQKWSEGKVQEPSLCNYSDAKETSSFLSLNKYIYETLAEIKKNKLTRIASLPLSWVHDDFHMCNILVHNLPSYSYNLSSSAPVLNVIDLTNGCQSTRCGDFFFPFWTLVDQMSADTHTEEDYTDI